MQIHRDWKRILLCTWSVRMMLLAALLGGVAAGLPIAQPYLDMNPLVVACAVGIATCGAALAGIFARVVQQDGFDGA